jgi:plasmid stabilization system protein ParE
MEIQFLKLARDEINSIKQHIKADSGQEKADAIAEDLIAAIMRLKTAPTMGHLPRELHNFPLQNVLEIVAVNDTYRIIYELYPKKIVIHIVCHYRRDMLTLLTKRLLSKARFQAE